ncbi:unnamed protein product, partial [Heterotrigona itama]
FRCFKRPILRESDLISVEKAHNMEVLDPSVSRDDQPLCVNDSLEK